MVQRLKPVLAFLIHHNGQLNMCPELDNCWKIKMILDKDLAEFQYAECIRKVCGKCKRKDSE
jgi:hypothetical protein